MHLVKPTAYAILAFFALAFLFGPIAFPSESGHYSKDIIAAAVPFLSVIILQFLLWRLILPPHVANLLKTRPRDKSKPKRGFLSGSISFGYLLVAIYCVKLAGYLPPDRLDPSARNSELFFGLILIGLGMAGQLRDAFSELAKMAGLDAPAPPTDQAIPQSAPS
jgi:hypothetical protein